VEPYPDFLTHQLKLVVVKPKQAVPLGDGGWQY
jgi:hypothetical protein